MRRFFESSLALMLALMLSASCYCNGRGEGSGKTAYRIVTYNVGVFSKYMANSTTHVSDMMREIGADVMILNELDRYNNRHSTDQLAEFASAMDWNSRYAAAMQWNGGEYGIGAAWSRTHEEVSSCVIALPKISGSEPRCCIVIEFEDFVLAGTHLEVSSEQDRIEGVRIITDSLQQKYASGAKPVILCGDMNAEPSSATIAELKKNWTQISPSVGTYPSSAPAVCIDYIFALNGVGKYKVISSEVCTHFRSADVTLTSDHLPVYADIELL